MALWHWLEDVAGLFVNADFADSSNVTLIVAEWLGDEGSNQLENLVLGVLAGTNSNHVCVVVLTSKFRCVEVPGQGGTNALYLVCGDLLTVA